MKRRAADWMKIVAALALAVLCPLSGCTGNAGSSTDSSGTESTGGKKEPSVYKGLAASEWDINVEPVGTDKTGENTAIYDQATGIATFTYVREGCSVTYTVNCGSDALKAGVLEIDGSLNGGTPIRVVQDAGTHFAMADGTEVPPEQFLAKGGTTQLEPSFADNTLTLNYTDTFDGLTAQKSYTIRILNTSLIIHVGSENITGKPGYSGFTTGFCRANTSIRGDMVVYAEDVSVLVADGNAFVSAYLDKTQSYATRMNNTHYSPAYGDIPACEHGMQAVYELNSAEERNPLDEKYYVTLSNEFLDCTYLTNAEKSKYRDSLTDLVVYDTWNAESQYARRRMNCEWLAEAGAEDVMYIEHMWQRDWLDTSNPAFYPAMTSYGSAEKFAEYLDTVLNKLGWKFALHECYWFIQPSERNQYWVDGVENELAQLADGSLRPAWWKLETYAFKADEMTKYAAIESQKIKDNYKTNATFVDVNGSVDINELNQVTLNADSITSRTVSSVVSGNINLFRKMSEIYDGPIMSEGARDMRDMGSVYAGYMDAVEREITGYVNCRIMPDYELHYIRPLMANQGMGYPDRFEPDVPTSTSVYNWDKYNAASIAYGHTGFMSVLPGGPVTGVKEQNINIYYMFRALQAQYLDTSVTVDQIAYFDAAGNEYTLNEAVLANYNFQKARLYTRYSNGLEVYLNFDDTNWEVTLNGNKYLLDKNAWATENPSEDFVEFSCLLNGNRVDYVDCKDYTYMNGRGTATTFPNGKTSTDQTWEQK
ncbi:MAG: hypothetical protein E7486_02140 [Ruminococcaceae bacterium]|nr:hypothetical protein [Oscillospiraceae bacterium]